MFVPPPNKILYCHGKEQSLFTDMERTIPSIAFHKGLPSEELLESYLHDPSCNIIVLDDLMESVVSNSDMQQIFTLGAHHRRLTVIYLNQNIYCKGSKAKHAFSDLNEKSERSVAIECLSRQVFPGKSKLLVEAYRDCMKTPFAYLVVD